MNRPLFFAVMCFALGEVIYIIADKGSQIGAIILAPICGALFFVRMGIKKRRVMLGVLFLIIGILRVWIAEEYWIGEKIFGDEGYERTIDNYGKFYITYGQYYNYNVHGVNIRGIGVIDNIAQGSNGYNVTIKLMDSSTDNLNINKDFKIIIYGVESYSVGDTVSVSGVINPFLERGNPGEFNRYNYYKARGIVGYVDVSNGELKIEPYKLGQMEKLWYKLKSGLYELRNGIRTRLNDICAGENIEIYSGMLLGDKSNIDEQAMLMYRLSGIAHIFAISGLHVSIVGGLLYKLLRRLGLKFFPATMVAMSVTLLYGIMTGFSFSTVRAVVMLGLSLGGEVLGRRYDMITGMGLALGILLMLDPFRICDGGLILSFGAVTGVAMSKYIIKLLDEKKKVVNIKKKKKKLYGLMTAVVFSAGINVVTIPLISYMYFQLPLYSLVINMIVVPLMSVIVFSAFMGVLVSFLWPFLGKILILPSEISLKIINVICEAFQKLPFGVINTGKPSEIEMIVYYIILVIVLVLINRKNISVIRKKIYAKTKKWIPYDQVKWICLMTTWIIVASGVLIITIQRREQMRNEVIFLDVGQGDGILIKCMDGTNMVIDLGSASNESLGQYVACPALLSEGMGQVDYWFISHFDKDHTSGLEYILNSEVYMGIEICNLVISDNQQSYEDVTETGNDLIDLAEEKGINIIYMKVGDYIGNGAMTIKAIHPGSEFEASDKNQGSLVLSYSCDDVKMLFTGDIDHEAMESILNNDMIVEPYDVIKVAHHGSKYSLNEQFYEGVNPTISVISCGKNNMYGHPHKETLSMLEEYNSKIYRTDYMGAVRIIINK